MRTVGVSIAIPEPYFSQLREMRRAAGDPLADAVPPHVTLMPPTEVEDVSLTAFAEHLRDVARGFAPFEMILRGTGTFRPTSPVVFVQLAQGVDSCEQLESAVRAGPVGRELEFRYHPHVTIAHHVDDAALERAFEADKRYEAAFTVTEFHLYHQEPDGVWSPVEAFPLQG
ncbi:2'-5' RNA ligase family protein [Dermacoccus sp. GAS27A]|uniref:2'-5' RNA ligase family protein n=1 Tax=Dermacoccus sp. GAS27A TaxID=3156270 RepID=UPI00384EBB58